ncbi:MAG: M3 family oligoendopeptidase [Candidatus Marinimicrobia bacterium]|nr:M3 family oligoendopeptidase [Candidatus Neomarinimicrobiota bacterium]
MKWLSLLLVPIVFVLSFCGRYSKMEVEAKNYVDSLTSVVEPIYKAANLAYWNATATGKQKYYDEYSRYELEIKKIFSSRKDFARIKSFKEDRRIKDPVLRRVFEVLYNDFLLNQADTTFLRRITELSTRVEKKFNTFRGEIDGKKVSMNEVKRILRTSNDTELRRKAWVASKQVGEVVVDDLLELVRLRNELACSLGFPDYHTLKLYVQEFKPEELDRLFDRLDEVTREPFARIKAEIDSILAARFGVEEEELRPYHYSDPFFQEAPNIYTISLDRYYKDANVAELVSDFYKSMGIDVQPIIERSDLYEREGKYPHAYCTNIDRKGDIRVMVNLKPTEQWVETMLHELGHAIYEVYIDPTLPFFLRDPAHSFTTEAVAMFFGRLSKNPEWMREMLNLSEQETEKIRSVVEKTLTMEQLIFARWAQVMYRFEKALYKDPDADLNELWWDLVEKYQKVRRIDGRDKPDWATKIHICSYPVYYHNYMLGELLASQFLFTIMEEEGVDKIKDLRFAGNIKMGKYFVNRVFRPGKKYRWDRFVEYATGESLNPEYFVKQFCR